MLFFILSKTYVVGTRKSLSNAKIFEHPKQILKTRLQSMVHHREYLPFYLTKLHAKTVKEEMHLQENILLIFNLYPRVDLVVKVTRNVAQCPLYNVTCAPKKIEVVISQLGMI